MGNVLVTKQVAMALFELNMGNVLVTKQVAMAMFEAKTRYV